MIYLDTIQDIYLRCKEKALKILLKEGSPKICVKELYKELNKRMKPSLRKISAKISIKCFSKCGRYTTCFKHRLKLHYK